MSARDAYAAIADPTRREILALLRDRGTLMAGDIAASFTAASRPGISRHLRVLKECGVVDAQREGKAQLYTLECPAAPTDPRRLARELRDDADGQPEGAAETRRGSQASELMARSGSSRSKGDSMAPAYTYRRLDKTDAAVLLVDHQSGLLQPRRATSRPDEFKNNVLALADLAKYFKLPTILTTSFEDGPERPAGAGAEGAVSRTRRTSPGPATSTPGTTRTSSRR